MKLTVILLTASFLQVSAKSYSQIISFSGEEVPLTKIFQEVKKQTGLLFFYDRSILSEARPVTIRAVDRPLVEFLTAVFEHQPLRFSIESRTITVSRKYSYTTIPSQSIFTTEPVPVNIEGKVTNADGQPLEGATILVKGTSNGTQSDSNGNFSIAADPNSTLVISYVGYESVEVKPGNRTTISVQLTPSTETGGEIVVVGYGVQRRSDLTGAVASVKAETLQERPAATLNQALAGRLSGVNVTSNSGRPGGKTNIRIRGNTSVSVANDPLYVVDGVILITSGLASVSSPIDYINPNDIVSVEVLKDASATAIYGARGANGVIMITTKRGSKSGGRINYDNYFSTTTLPKKIPLLNAKEFLMVEDIAFQNAQKYDSVGYAGGKYQDPALKRTDPRLFDSKGDPLYDTDWQDEVIQSALTQSHQLSFTDGNNKGSYGAFLGYVNENGLMKISWLKRFSGRFVFDSQITDWLKVGGSLSYNDQNERHLQGAFENTSAGWIGRNMVENLPIVPVKYPDGSWAGNADYPGMEGGTNPVRVGEEYEYYLRTLTTLGNMYSNITLAKNLDLRTNVGINSINQKTSVYGGRELSFISQNQQGDAVLTSDQHTSWQFENYLTYTKAARVHSFTGLLGVSWQHVNRFNFTARTQQFSDDFYRFNNLGAGSVVVRPSSGASGYGLNSYFGRVNYGLHDKYLVTFTGRADGSSKFGAANRYAFFPSAAIAWRMSKEDFIQDIPAISNLKLRASYGETGNSEIAAYQSLARVGNYSYVFNGAIVSGTGISRLANSILQWEKTRQADLGIELGLFNESISMEVDFYRKLTTDMLLNSPIPASSGYTTVAKNIGSMENRGVEFAINTRNIDRNDFLWETTFNLSINRNKVTALSGGSDIFEEANIIRVGEPVSTFFGLNHLGTWSTDEASIAAKYNRLPGDIKYEDVNNDGQINQADRIILGKGIPDGFGALMNKFRYKNFDLIVDIQFQYGNEVLWRAQASLEDRQGIANSFKTVLNAWTPENQHTRIAQLRPIAAGYDVNNDASKIYDGSFIRGRNMLLGYSFSPAITRKLHLSRLKVYASVQNFFLRTRFPGYDPESQTTGSTFGQGYINYTEYPKPRVFMVGLNVGFN